MAGQKQTVDATGTISMDKMFRICVLFMRMILLRSLLLSVPTGTFSILMYFEGFRKRLCGHAPSKPITVLIVGTYLDSG